MRTDLAALGWWHDRCIEWCYQRFEDGRFGDQKYLDDWPTRFEGVHVLEHPGGGLAPWNISAHRLGESEGSVLVDGQPLIFFHHHALHLFQHDVAGRFAVMMRELRRPPRGGTLLWTTDAHYPVSPRERRLIWDTYLLEIEDALGLCPRGRYGPRGRSRQMECLGIPRTVSPSRLEIVPFRPEARSDRPSSLRRSADRALLFGIDGAA